MWLLPLGRPCAKSSTSALCFRETPVAAYADGTMIELRAGSVFYIPPIPHDSWVVGDEPYVSIHLQGAQHYTK